MSDAGEGFRTPRLLLRPWCDSDAPAVLAMYEDPEVARWTSTPEPMSTLVEARRRLEDWAAARDDERGFGHFAIVPDGYDEPVGNVLLRAMDGVDDAEVGWALRSTAQGHGWATEAARGVVDRARAFGHPRVRAVMWPDNHRSAGVCERLGMVDLGEVDDPWYGSEEFPTSRMFLLEL